AAKRLVGRKTDGRRIGQAAANHDVMHAVVLGGRSQLIDRGDGFLLAIHTMAFHRTVTLLEIRSMHVCHRKISCSSTPHNERHSVARLCTSYSKPSAEITVTPP